MLRYVIIRASKHTRNCGFRSQWLWHVKKSGQEKDTSERGGQIGETRQLQQRSQTIQRAERRRFNFTEFFKKLYHILRGLESFLSHATKTKWHCDYKIMLNCKGKAIPLQPWTGPAVSRSLRLPDFKTIDIRRWKGCQPYAPSAFTPRKYSWYSFLLDTESIPGI